MEVTEASTDEQAFESGWNTHKIETDILAAGVAKRVDVTFAGAIFRVMSALDIIELRINGTLIDLVFDSDHSDDQMKEWRVRDGHVIAAFGSRVSFVVKNCRTDAADPLIYFIARTPRRS